MKKTKLEKGITLVALIITIIVLLILAAVAIAAVNNTGIIGKAEEAKTSHEAGKVDEESKLQGYESFIESNVPGGNGGGENPPPQEPVMPVAAVGKIAEKNSTINGEAYSSINPIIPAGFAPINITTTGQESSWDAEGGPQVDNGLVITDNVTQHSSGKATIGSEFVWIPVSDINKMIMCQEHGDAVKLDKKTLQCAQCEADTKLAGKLYTDVNDPGGEFDSSITGQTYKNARFREPDIVEGLDKNYTQFITKEQLQDEFDNMAKSVAEYGGFYVARYEMSLTEGKKAQAKYGATSSDASQEDTNMWYGLYTKSKTYENQKSSVQSTMIWGSQYDAMMLWMEKNGANVNGNIGELRNKERTCGTDPDDIIKNIYDLYGNSFEWTLDAVAIIFRANRGGSLVDNSVVDGIQYNYRSPSSRMHQPSINNYTYYGSRLTLYIDCIE